MGFPSLGHLIIDPIADIAQQTLPAGSEWYAMIESVQNIFPTLIDICIILLISVAVINVIKR